jgi:formylmethanofuran:tetrahydromethanopterin formyltransferase
LNAYAPSFTPSLESIWLQTFWQYIAASIQSGKAYLPHEQNNIAVEAVYLADSAKQAYQERFGIAAPHSGGGVAPQASKSDSALFDALDAPRTQPSVVGQIDQALSKMQAASNPAPQFRPSRTRAT